MPRNKPKKPVTTRKQKIAVSRAVQSTSAVLNSNGSFTAEYLESPVKSQRDENEYRVIRLSNGLTATLILRPGVISGEEDSQKANKTNDYNGKEINEKEDFPWYRTMMTQGKTIFPETSCKLCINVGSFSDPLRVPATSRLLSRVIVTGSKKYPQDDDFTKFIITNGGFRLSYDRCENTTFYFQIPDKFLRRAINRFAQFFVAPLVKRSSIMNGRDEIITEHREILRFPECPDRKEHLFGSLGSPGSPARVFRELYLDPLGSASDDEVYREVLKFREQHYTADRMTLVIESRLPLDTLEAYVKEYFSKIPNNPSSAESPNLFNCTDCFRTRDFNKIYEMKPLLGDIDAKVLELTWPIPPRQKYYRSKPEKYLAWLMKRNGDGSLLSYLRKQKWCFNVYSGVDERCVADNLIYSLFNVSFVLTDEGYDNRKSVLDAVYSYIHLLRREGPQKRIYDEIRNIEEAKFSFTNERRWAGPFHDLGEDMHRYPSTDYLTGRILFFEYDSAVIEECTNFLTPDRANIIVFDQNFNEIDQLVEGSLVDQEDDRVYYERVYYTCHDIPQAWIKHWKIVEPFSEFYLPKANVFIADNFELIPVNEDLSRYPVKIQEDDLTEIWYMADAKFRLPEAYMIYNYVSPLKWASCEITAMFDLFLTSLEISLLEELDPARIAGLQYDIHSSERGFEVRVNGFNQKLPLLMETINKRIAEFSDLVAKNSFEEMREKQLKAYLDVFCNAKKLARDVRLSILRPVYWTSVDRHAAITGLKYETFQHFVRHFVDHVRLQCLVQGNIERDTVIENVRKCVEILKLKPILSNNVQPLRIREIPRAPRCYRVRGFENGNWVQNYYQFDASSLKISVMIDLLINIINNPLCNELNTLEELNHWEFNPLKEIQGYSLAVEPYRRQINNEIVWGDKSIEKFRKLLNKTLRDLSYNKWNCVKKVLTTFKEEAVNNLRDEVARNWQEIVSGEYIFDRPQRELKVINDLEIKDLQEFMPILTMGGPNMQKLSVQVVGDEVSKPTRNNENKPQYHLEYLTALPSLKEKMSDYYITDVEAYKRDLRVFQYENKIAEKIERDCQISSKE